MMEGKMRRLRNDEGWKSRCTVDEGRVRRWRNV